MKHLNPRQGITTSSCVGWWTVLCGKRCETPKSPPGDYNMFVSPFPALRRGGCGVKHLNPRQGITTDNTFAAFGEIVPSPCETPKSPPGDYNVIIACLLMIDEPISVKHLNPRQGITTIEPERVVERLTILV